LTDRAWIIFMVILASSRTVVLVVEDDLLIRMNALETIGEAGFEVIEASNPDEAILMLGRAEDPNFTIKTLTVTTVWPGATAREMQDLRGSRASGQVGVHAILPSDSDRALRSTRRRYRSKPARPDSRYPKSSGPVGLGSVPYSGLTHSPASE
jgi:CheY-like chemotaxis protein